MHIVLVTAPTTEPVTLDELKLHLKVDDDSTDDEYLESIIKAARGHVEDLTNRAIMTQTWDYYIDNWPSADYIKLPFGNLQNATGTEPTITWKDDDGDITTLTVTTDYLVEQNGEGCGRIVLPYGESWPSGTLYPSNPIKIRFFCGWTTAALVPAKIKQAIMMICSDLNEDRGEAVLGQTVSENKTVTRLLASMKLWDEF